METTFKLVARAYQLEMFEASMQGNIIAVMGTGTGKTNIAAMRIYAELQKTPDKLIWFTAPTRPLALQQRDFLASQLTEYQIRTLTGDDDVEFWKSQTIWDAALTNIHVVVSTPQVLLDALSNAFVRLLNISLLVIDEAHHCQANTKSASALIMRNHYHPLKAKDSQAVPHVLGLTASIRISKKAPEIPELEKLLDARCREPFVSIDEYATYVNSPQLLGIGYTTSSMPCTNIYLQLCDIVAKLDIRQDPRYKQLQDDDSPHAKQKLEKWERSNSTDNTKLIVGLKNAVEDLLLNLGTWAADDFVAACIRKFQSRFGLSALPTSSDRFVSDILAPLEGVDRSCYSNPKVSPKARALVDFLTAEFHEKIAVIIFVERRSTAYALCRLLSVVPELQHYQVCVFTGRGGKIPNTLLELVDGKQQQREFDEFRDGLKHICVATSIAEEGIDIQAVNIVVRFDNPKSLKALIQSRGRARRPNSKFVYFYQSSEEIANYSELLREEEKTKKELEDSRNLLDAQNDFDPSCDEEYLVEATGAKLFHNNAVTHLQHFCAIAAKGDPLYLLSGVLGLNLRARVILPSSVPVAYQEFSSARSWCGEKAARSDAAFQAYKALHEAGLVTDNLVPFQHDRSRKVQTKNQGKNYEINAERCVWSQEFKPPSYYVHQIRFSRGSSVYRDLKIAIPRSIDHDLCFVLYENSQEPLEIEVKPLELLHLTDYTAAIEMTRNLFAAAFQAGTAWSSLSDPMSIPFLILPDENLDIDCGSKEQTLSEFLQQAGTGILEYPLFVWKQSEHYRRPRLWSPDACIPNKNNAVIKARKVKRLGLHISAVKPDLISSMTAKPDELSINQCLFRGIDSILGPSTRMIPSILHIMTLALRAQDARETLFSSMQFTDSSLLMPALAAMSASASLNYEKLEFLGDAYLKFRVSLQIFHDDPLAMEGILTERVDNLVNNERLHQYTRDSGLAGFVSTELPATRHWCLPQITRPDAKPLMRTVNSKTLADVVESTLAAAVLGDQREGSDDQKSTAMLKLIYPEIEWLTASAAVMGVQTRYASQSDARGHLGDYITQMLDYSFDRNIILRESLTHSAPRQGVLSYNRLEFLGDAILDWIIKRKLFKCEGKTPGSMTILRHALVSHSFLAYCALNVATSRIHQDIELNDGVYTPKNIHETICLTDLVAITNESLRARIHAARKKLKVIESKIVDSFKQGIFPWTLLRSLDAPKVCSDITESLLAAVYIDSGGHLVSCEETMRKLGILDALSVMLEEGFDARTPATILREACAARHWEVDIKAVTESQASKHVSKVYFRNMKGVFHEVTGADACCDEEARSLAAEGALRALDHLCEPVEDQDKQDEDVVMSQSSDDDDLADTGVPE